MYRKLDTETRYIANNWRKPHCDDPDLWFAMVVARLVNWHESLEKIGYSIPWRPKHFIRVLDIRLSTKQKAFSGAYKIGTDASGGSKTAYLATKVLSPMWEDRKILRRIAYGTLAQAHRTLLDYQGMGSFIAGQVIADLKYSPPMNKAKDWWTWAASGPGSRRGLNRVLCRPVKSPWDESEWFRQLTLLRKTIKPIIITKGMRNIHAQDLQNCLCEFDKYLRVKLGEGKPRSKYPGAM